MAIIRPGERMDFLHEQVLTSRNVDGHRFTDFWYGGLNYQIEHHLFPTMPRNRLGEAQVIVREFCREHDIPYCSTGLFASYREVLGYLNRVSAPLRGG
jgi:fatty acid desaturase